ncbi:unnamed protein product [Cladocopium goreaui]|uniref:RidA family protein n=1 Tax=Cladocopium goreaui TaxID=2562237 RepID=A0A9P1CQM2_9DINO|nr:unnamed protein product [Cladocopium goreaui]
MALRHASGLEKLRAEFDHFQETEDWKVVRQKAGPVEHLLVPGLPRLGASHASLSGSQIHLAPALGQQLNVGGIALVPGGLAAQAYRCCQILEQVLLACGSSLQQLVRLSCHVSHLTSFNSEVPGPSWVEAGWKAEKMGKTWKSDQILISFWGPSSANCIILKEINGYSCHII